MEINPLYLLVLIGAWILSMLLWYYLLFVRLPRAPKDIIEYILDRLDDKDDKEIHDLFMLLWIRLYDGLTKNPELRQKFIGFVQNQILSSIKQFEKNLKGKSMPGPGEGGLLEQLLGWLMSAIKPEDVLEMIKGRRGY